MRYMVLVYDCARYAEGSDEAIIKGAAVGAYVDMLRERGVFRGADPLRSVEAATSVRVRDGEVLVTDGPFVETREWLAGYFLLECHDLDEALQLAAACPMAAEGGVEVRPILPAPGLHHPVDELRTTLTE